MGCNTSKEALAPVLGEAGAGDPLTVLNKRPLNKLSSAQDDDHDEIAEELEDLDVDLEDPDLEQAATKIQAAFRGHQTRKNMKPGEDDRVSDPADPTKEQLEAEFDPNDQELCNAATKIQASFRGHMSRKVGGKADDETDKNTTDSKEKELADELADIDLTDPDLHKAATKIQASFRGHKVRKTGDE